MAREDWGPSVLNGEVLRTSPSALQTADPNSPWGCPRKYWYGYVMGIKEPEKEPAKLGKKIHKEIELHLKNGKKALSAIAMSALKYYPAAKDPNLELEYECSPLECFEVAGIPVLMYLDCISPYHTYLDTMGAWQEDPPGTIEIIDWKSKGNISYALTNQQLLDTIQMGMYGAYGLRRYNADHVRLSHVYLQTKGRKKASKSTILATPETIGQKWPRIESVGRSIIDYAKEPDVNKIPVNLKECGKCYYADRCPKTTNHTIEMVFGKAHMSPLLPAENTAPAGAPLLDTAGHLAALQAEEAAKVAATALAIPEGFAAALAFIQVHDYGRPALSGRAYLASCSVNGIAPDAAMGAVGEGKAGVVAFDDPGDVVRLATEVASKVGVPFVIPAPVLPADAPASNPALAADPVPGFGHAAAPVETAAPVAVAPAAAAAALRSGTPPPVVIAPSGGSDNLKKCIEAAGTGKGWPTKPALQEGFTELLTRDGGTPISVQSKVDVVAYEPTQVYIYIDCVAKGTDLAPWIKQFTDLLCKEYGCLDVRMADPKSKLGYGGWKGAIAVCVAESYKTLAPGAYTLDTRGSEILEAAAAGFEASQVTARGIR